MTTKAKRKSTERDDEGSLLSAFEDFAIDGDLLSFTDHAGIKTQGVAADRMWDVFRDNYTTDGAIDLGKFATDLATWGPIASRVVALQLERRNAACA
jgi:hypothetical protein